MEHLFGRKMRIYIGRIVGVAALLYGALQKASYLPQWLLDISELARLVLLAVATFGRMWSLIYISGNKNRVLTVAGPYSIVRHPLYVFSFLGVIGLGLSIEQPVLALLLALGFAFFYHRAVLEEEKNLLNLFGEEYRAYMSRVPRWVPNLKLFHEPDQITLNPILVRKNLFGTTWFLWMFLLWEIIEDLHSRGYLILFR